MLIKHHEHVRKEYRKQNSYLKTYTPNHLYDYDWLVDNVKQLEKFMPGYVIDYGIKEIINWLKKNKNIKFNKLGNYKLNVIDK